MFIFTKQYSMENKIRDLPLSKDGKPQLLNEQEIEKAKQEYKEPSVVGGTTALDDLYNKAGQNPKIPSNSGIINKIGNKIFI